MLTDSLCSRLRSWFPLVSRCFLGYLRQVEAQVPEGERRRFRYYQGLVNLLGGEEIDVARCLGVWAYYEKCFQQSRSILGVSEEKFLGCFEFNELERVLEARAPRSYVAEVLFVVDLHEASFRSIEKIQRTSKGKTADFVAQRNQHKYAIELKSLKSIGDDDTGAVLIDVPTLRGAEIEAHRAHLEEMLQRRDGQALKQLEETCRIRGCNKKVFAFDSDYVGKGAALLGALSRNEVTRACEQARKSYPEVDHIAYKWMVNEPESVIFVPPL